MRMVRLTTGTVLSSRCKRRAIQMIEVRVRDEDQIQLRQFRGRSAGAMNRRGPPVIRPRPTPTLLNITGSVSTVMPPTRSRTVAWPIQHAARSAFCQLDKSGVCGASARRIEPIEHTEPPAPATQVRRQPQHLRPALGPVCVFPPAQIPFSRAAIAPHDHHESIIRRSLSHVRVQSDYAISTPIGK